MKPFESYIEDGSVRRATPDPALAASLMKKASARLRFISALDVTPDNAPFVLEAAYEVMRETAQHLMALSGFKPYSHEATIAFLRDRTEAFSSAEIAELDRFRRLRNDSVYRAASVACEEAVKSLELAKVLIERFTY